jgi:hypothetical protein
MANIGERMIATRKNYEEVLLSASNGQPTIPGVKIHDVLEKTLQIRLEPTEKRELNSFIKERSGNTGLVKLQTFLEYVGLPAQIVGIGIKKAGVKNLTAQDLKFA